MEYVPKFPKPGKKSKKRPKPLSKRSKKKMDDGRQRIIKELKSLCVEIASYGKKACEKCVRPALVYQVHHVITKGSSKALEFDTDNLVYLCQGCHYQAHNAGYMDFALWFDKKFPGRCETLKLRKNNRFPCTKSNLELTKIGLERELKQLKGRENNGEF